MFAQPLISLGFAKSTGIRPLRPANVPRGFFRHRESSASLRITSPRWSGVRRPFEKSRAGCPLYPEGEARQTSGETEPLSNLTVVQSHRTSEPYVFLEEPLSGNNYLSARTCGETTICNRLCGSRANAGFERNWKFTAVKEQVGRGAASSFHATLTFTCRNGAWPAGSSSSTPAGRLEPTICGQVAFGSQSGNDYLSKQYLETTVWQENDFNASNQSTVKTGMSFGKLPSRI